MADGHPAPAHAAVFDGIRTIAGDGVNRSSQGWVSAVTESVPLPVRGLVQELSVAPLPTRLDPESGHPPQRYLDALVIGVHDSHLSRRIADAHASQSIQQLGHPINHPLRGHRRGGTSGSEEEGTGQEGPGEEGPSQEGPSQEGPSQEGPSQEGLRSATTETVPARPEQSGRAARSGLGCPHRYDPRP